MNAEIVHSRTVLRGTLELRHLSNSNSERSHRKASLYLLCVPMEANATNRIRAHEKQAKDAAMTCPLAWRNQSSRFPAKWSLRFAK
jgi:hypothetical protein